MNSPNASYVIHVAAEANQLDNIKINPVDDFIPIRKKIFVWKSKNWEKEIVKKAADFLNEDIRKNLLQYQYLATRIPTDLKEKPQIYVYDIARIHKYLFWVTLNMHYKIK